MVNNFKQKTQSYITCKKILGEPAKRVFISLIKPPPTPSTLPVFSPFLLNQPNVTLFLCRSSYTFYLCYRKNFFFFFCLQLPRFSDQYTDLGTENSTILNMGIQTRQKMKTHTKNSTILNMGISTKQKSHKKNSTIQI